MPRWDRPGADSIESISISRLRMRGAPGYRGDVQVARGGAGPESLPDLVDGPLYLFLLVRRSIHHVRAAGFCVAAKRFTYPAATSAWRHILLPVEVDICDREDRW